VYELCKIASYSIDSGLLERKADSPICCER
jgi:hypothetical protein